MKPGAAIPRLVRLPSLPDGLVNRLILASVLVLVIGVPVFGAYYVLDRNVDAGPSLVERQLASAVDAVRQQPNSVPRRLALGAAYGAANRLGDALAQYDEVLKVEPDNRTALLGRGDALVTKGDLDGAAAAFQKIVDDSKGGEFAPVDPQLEQAYYSLGSIALKRDGAANAVPFLEAAVKIEPTDADAWYLLGTAYLGTGASQRAADALRRAVLFVPTGWCEPYARLAEAETALSHPPQAEYAGAMVDFCQKRLSDAQRRLERLVSGPVAVDALLGLGMIAEAQEDRDAAVADYRRVLALDAKNFNALEGLARLGAGPPGAHPSAPAAGGNN